LYECETLSRSLSALTQGAGEQGADVNIWIQNGISNR